MNCGIYIIKNLVDGKCYVGKSKNLSKRIAAHKQSLKRGDHYNNHLQNSFKLYKEHNFIFKIILECLEKDLSYFEKFYCDIFNSHNKNRGFNIEPIKEEENRILKRNPETIEKMRLIRLGMKHTEETKLKMSKFQKGKFVSEQTREKISNAFKIPLIVMNLNNTILFEFESMIDAGNFLNIKPAYISERLRTKSKRYKNFIFVRKKDFDINKDYTLLKKDVNYLCKKIVSIDKENNVTLFNSVKEAAIKYNTVTRTISRVLTNKRKQNKGIKFMYWEDYKKAFENNGILNLEINYE